jgi:tetratricopeptide (TPR) repeat protein
MKRAQNAARPRRDIRLPATLALVLSIGTIGFVADRVPGRAEYARPPSVLAQDTSARSSFEGLSAPVASERVIEEVILMPPSLEPSDDTGRNVRKLLKESAGDVKAKRYDQALRKLDAARPAILAYPEAFVLVGRSLEGKKEYADAQAFYNAALDRDPTLAEAYWGMATTAEAMGDLEMALGGMRSFLKTVPDPDPFRLKVAQARSAIWEWESQLGRGPWGPTRGIIPGLTRDQQARNDKGVGIMYPVPGSEQPDGSKKIEVRNQDRFKIYSKP